MPGALAFKSMNLSGTHLSCFPHMRKCHVLHPVVLHWTDTFWLHPYITTLGHELSKSSPHSELDITG